MGNAEVVNESLPSGTVHPHVHGERPPKIASGMMIFGSSPRTWGTRYFLRFATLYRRFIPTYMGNAIKSPDICSIRSVHPHVHGERFRYHYDRIPNVGSSPRTWGTPTNRNIDTILFRFIPTYMGNAIAHARKEARETVHPHVHGERLGRLGRLGRAIGSSPRTWGTHR